MVGFLAEIPDLWDFCLVGWENDSQTSRFSEEGGQEPFVAGLMRLTTKPVVGVGRYTSPDRMAAVIRKGIVDLIGCARPSISELLPQHLQCSKCLSIEEIRAPVLHHLAPVVEQHLPVTGSLHRVAHRVGQEPFSLFVSDPVHCTPTAKRGPRPVGHSGNTETTHEIGQRRIREPTPRLRRKNETLATREFAGLRQDDKASGWTQAATDRQALGTGSPCPGSFRLGCYCPAGRHGPVLRVP